jgi:hypothetical protein
MRLTEKVKLVEVRFQSNADLLIPSEFSIIEKTPMASLVYFCFKGWKSSFNRFLESPDSLQTLLRYRYFAGKQVIFSSFLGGWVI